MRKPVELIDRDVANLPGSPPDTSGLLFKVFAGDHLRVGVDRRRSEDWNITVHRGDGANLIAHVCRLSGNDVLDDEPPTGAKHARHLGDAALLGIGGREIQERIERAEHETELARKSLRRNQIGDLGHIAKHGSQ